MNDYTCTHACFVRHFYKEDIYYNIREQNKMMYHHKVHIRDEYILKHMLTIIEFNLYSKKTELSCYVKRLSLCKKVYQLAFCVLIYT